MTVARETGLGSMRELSRSVRTTDRFGDSIGAIASFEQDWRCGRTPNLEQVWIRGGRSLALLSALVKVEIIARFENGESPTVREYLDRFPELQAADEQVISLLYEEYCLLEEAGQAPPVDHFCEQYRSWADSLASQLRYHRLLSQVAMVPSATKSVHAGIPSAGSVVRRSVSHQAHPGCRGSRSGLSGRPARLRTSGRTQGQPRPGAGTRDPGPPGSRPRHAGLVGLHRRGDRASRDLHAVPTRLPARPGGPPPS